MVRHPHPHYATMPRARWHAWYGRVSRNRIAARRSGVGNMGRSTACAGSRGGRGVVCVGIGGRGKINLSFSFGLGFWQNGAVGGDGYAVPASVRSCCNHIAQRSCVENCRRQRTARSAGASRGRW